MTGQRGRLQRLEGQRLQQEATQTEAQTYPTTEALEQMTLEELAEYSGWLNRQPSRLGPLDTDTLAQLKGMTLEEARAEYESWVSMTAEEQ